MSITNRHPLNSFVAGESKALTGQRLAKVGYKQTDAMTKRGEIAPPSVCASVPFLTGEQITPNIQRLLPYIGTMLENAQDGIIRSLYESSGHAMVTIVDDDISVDACISYMAAEAAGDRLKKEHIVQWFNDHVAENLTVFVADLLKFTELTPDNMVVINGHVQNYRNVLSMLASGKTILENKQINGCKRAIALADTAGSGIGEKLTQRLIAMEAPKKRVEELLDLG